MAFRLDTVRLAKASMWFCASTITESDIGAWREAGGFSRFTHVIISTKTADGPFLQRIRDQPKTAFAGYHPGFCTGNKELRGPLEEGLPTANPPEPEEEVLLNMLELYYDGLCDVVLVGCGCDGEAWQDIACLSRDYVS
ncbi:MAG: hypothetical protein ACLRXA_22960 [Clostridium sp.]